MGTMLSWELPSLPSLTASTHGKWDVAHGCSPSSASAAFPAHILLQTLCQHADAVCSKHSVPASLPFEHPFLFEWVLMTWLPTEVECMHDSTLSEPTRHTHTWCLLMIQSGREGFVGRELGSDQSWTCCCWHIALKEQKLLDSYWLASGKLIKAFIFLDIIPSLIS